MNSKGPAANPEVSNFLYLFIMDVVCVPFKSFADYKNKEPGFDKAMMQGYCIAFDCDHNGKISHNLLQRIHHAAVSHLMCPRGEYKIESNNYKTWTENQADNEYEAARFSASSEGLIQFVQDWLQGEDHTHSVGIVTNPEPHIFYGAALRYNENLKFIEAKGLRPEISDYHPKKHDIVLRELMDKRGYKCTLDIHDGVSGGIKPLVIKQLDKIFKNYENDIEKARHDDEIIRAICKCIQHISQLHPFQDGNIRTCYILLNKLLNDFGLPLTILMNPNRFDLCSLDENVKWVKDGQKIYRDLLVNKSTEQFVIKTDETQPKLKSIECPAVKIGNEHLIKFAKIIMNRKDVTIKNDMYEPSFNNNYTEYKDFKLYLKEGRYGLALRRACADGLLNGIKFLLQNHRDEIENCINEQSSNKKTALDWLDGNKVKSLEYRKIREMLVNMGAKSKEELAAVSQFHNNKNI